MSDNHDMINRHEEKFTSIEKALNSFRDKYVKSQTFVVTLITVVVMVAGSSGWLFGVIFSNIDKNERSVLELAKQQVRLEEKQISLERTQDQTITQLISALKEIQKDRAN